MTGIIVAMPSEARLIFGKRQWIVEKGFRLARIGKAQGQDFICLISGAGPENSSKGATFLIEAGASELVSTGVCGALDPGLNSGSLIISDSSIMEKMDLAEKTYDLSMRRTVKKSHLLKFAEEKGYHKKPHKIITVESPVSDIITKRELRHRTGAVAVDMESAGVYEAASHAGLPFCAVRSICDSAHDKLPEQVLRCLRDDGTINLAGIAAACIKEPPLIKELLAMRNSYRQATCSLRKFWEMVFNKNIGQSS